MKIMIRAFVVALFVTGAIASTHVTAAQQTSSQVVLTKSSFYPLPSCPPNDPNSCNITNQQK